jgi:hypothetical protein
VADNDNILANIRAKIDFMAYVANEYKGGNISREIAEEQLARLEAELKALDPSFYIQNVVATLDEVERQIAVEDEEEYYESSEYYDEDE